MLTLVEIDVECNEMPDIRSALHFRRMADARNFMQKRAVVKFGQMYDAEVRQKAFMDKDVSAVQQAYHKRYFAEELPEVIITKNCIYVCNIEDCGFLLQIINSERMYDE